MLESQKVVEKLETVARDYNNLIIKAHQYKDEKKEKYYTTEYNRIQFSIAEIKQFLTWGFSFVTYITVLERWACVMPNDCKYLGKEYYFYSEENQPILFVSGTVDSVLDEYATLNT